MIVRLVNKILRKFNFILLNLSRYQNDANLRFDLRLKDYYCEIKNLFSENNIVFDIGACNGETIDLYNEIFENSNIHSIEPNTEFFDKLNITVKKLGNKNNNNFFTYKVALGEKNEIKKYNQYSNPVLSGFFNIDKTIASSIGKPAKLIKQIEMETETGDQFCKKNNIDIVDFMKINVQGFEPEILNGFDNMLKNSKIKFILVEFDYTHRYEREVKISDLENLLFHYQYGLFDIILLRRRKKDKIKLSYGLALFANKEINDNLIWL